MKDLGDMTAFLRYGHAQVIILNLNGSTVLETGFGHGHQ